MTIEFYHYMIGGLMVYVDIKELIAMLPPPPKGKGKVSAATIPC